MSEYSLYAQMLGLPLTEEEAAYEVAFTDTQTDSLLAHFQTAGEARRDITNRLTPFAWHISKRDTDPEDGVQEMLLGLGKWLTRNLSDEQWWELWTDPLGGLSKGQYGSLLRRAADAMRKARARFVAKREKYDQATYCAYRDQIQERNETVRIVRETISSLPAEHREILELRLEDLSIRDIAKRFGVSSATAQRKLKTAMEEFRKIF